MMNGINSFIARADLLDRTIILELERIPDKKRLPEDRAKLNEIHDKMLRGEDLTSDEEFTLSCGLC